MVPPAMKLAHKKRRNARKSAKRKLKRERKVTLPLVLFPELVIPRFMARYGDISLGVTHAERKRLAEDLEAEITPFDPTVIPILK